LEGRNHIILANDPAHRSFLNAVFSFLGDPPIKGVLPGGKKFKDRLENIVKGLEQNWFIKLIAILAALAWSFSPRRCGGYCAGDCLPLAPRLKAESCGGRVEKKAHPLMHPQC
jgi:hypothetical protein